MSHDLGHLVGMAGMRYIDVILFQVTSTNNNIMVQMNNIPYTVLSEHYFRTVIWKLPTPNIDMVTWSFL